MSRAEAAGAADLRLVIESQKEELSRLRVAQEVAQAAQENKRLLESEKRGGVGRDISDFTQQVRVKVDNLYKNSVSIDKEFAEFQ